MTYAVVFRRAAQREYADAVLWYEERRAGLGAEFASEVERAIESIAQNPARFPIMHRDVRCIRARRFPYSVFFRIEATRVVILAVFHAREETHSRGRAAHNKQLQRTVTRRRGDGASAPFHYAHAARFIR